MRKKPGKVVGAILALFFGGAFLAAAGPGSSAAEVDGVAVPCGFVGSDCSGGPRLAFTGGATSLEALVDQFLAALEKKDEAALHALRVTQDEYQQIIAAGAFKEGEAPKRYSAEVQKYFWGDLDHKNKLYATNLLKGFGGRSFPTRKFHFTEATRRHPWYQAHGELRIDLESPPSVPEQLATGWIAELDGRYKFIGFGYDD